LEPAPTGEKARKGLASTGARGVTLWLNRKETLMPNIVTDHGHQTVLTTFEVTPGTAQDLLDELVDAYDKVISKSPGFIGAAIHVNDAQTRVANYSQWQRREDFQAMLRSTEMRRRNRLINEMCKGFEPVMYDVVKTYE
jgi:heme-degrading monooxygenase HmoA